MSEKSAAAGPEQARLRRSRAQTLQGKKVMAETFCLPDFFSPIASESLFPRCCGRLLLFFFRMVVSKCQRARLSEGSAATRGEGARIRRSPVEVLQRKKVMAETLGSPMHAPPFTTKSMCSRRSGRFPMQFFSSWWYPMDLAAAKKMCVVRRPLPNNGGRHKITMWPHAGGPSSAAAVCG